MNYGEDFRLQFETFCDMKPFTRLRLIPGGRGTLYNGLYGEAPPESGTFFRLQVYKRVGISRVEVYKGREIDHLGI